MRNQTETVEIRAQVHTVKSRYSDSRRVLCLQSRAWSCFMSFLMPECYQHPVCSDRIHIANPYLLVQYIFLMTHTKTRVSSRFPLCDPSHWCMPLIKRMASHSGFHHGFLVPLGEKRGYPARVKPFPTGNEPQSVRASAVGPAQSPVDGAVQ